MRKRGDYSYIKKALFKKVYDGVNPLAIKNFYGTDTYVYKQINAFRFWLRPCEVRSREDGKNPIKNTKFMRCPHNAKTQRSTTK